jgi:hypothetical protein
MQIAPEVQELEELAQRAALPMSRVLAKAGVASTTYWRWRHSGSEPHTRTVRRLKAAIVELSGVA